MFLAISYPVPFFFNYASTFPAFNSASGVPNSFFAVTETHNHSLEKDSKILNCKNKSNVLHSRSNFFVGIVLSVPFSYLPTMPTRHFYRENFGQKILLLNFFLTE